MVVEPDAEASVLVVVTVYEAPPMTERSLQVTYRKGWTSASLAPNRREERADGGIAGWAAHRRLRRVGPTIGTREHRAAGGST